MLKDPQRLSVLFWNRYAALHDEVVGILYAHRQLRRMVGDQLAAVLKPGASCVELGCGGGRHLETLLEAYPDLRLRLMGVDISSAMLKIARGRLPSTVILRQEDINGRSDFLEDASLDAVMMIHVLYALSDPEARLRDIWRVLKPGGYLILVNPYNPHHLPIWKDHLAWMVRSATSAEAWAAAWALPALVQVIGVTAYLAHQAKKHSLHFLPPTVLSDMLRGSGFEGVEAIQGVYGGTSCLMRARKPVFP